MTDNSRTTGVFQRRKRSVYLALSFDNPLLQGFLALAMVSAAVALLVPGLSGGRPLLSRTDVGHIAPIDIVIPRDFTYTELDERATKEKREQAADAVSAVYDYRLGVKDRRLGNIQRAFQLQRDAIQAIADKLAALTQPPEGAQPMPAAERQRRVEELVDARGKAVLAARDDFFAALDEALTDEEYAAFAGSHFDKATEDHLSYLVSSAMGYKLLATSRELETLLRARQITLRLLRGPTSIDEIKLSSFEDFATVRQTAEQVAEKARQGLKGVDPKLRDVLVGVAERMVETNCAVNELETQKRRVQAAARVRELVTTTEFRAGQVLVDRGHKIEASHLTIYRVAFEPAGATDMAQVTVGLGALLVLLSSVLYRFSSKTIRKFAGARRDVLLLGFWGLALLLLARVAVTINPVLAEMWPMITHRALHYGFPAAAAAMLVRMVINAETTLVFAALSALVLGLVFDSSLTFGIYVLVGGLVGAAAVGHAKTRIEVLKAGVTAGLVNVVAVTCFSLVDGNLLTLGALVELVFAFVGGVLSGLMVTAIVPVVENLFDYTTNIKLLELANLNNPLLKDLAIRAPGTFHHSILTGTLAEAGAESIRANPLLARVGSYYHDVGKAKAPEYFAENQKVGRNLHDKLKPSMSALILKDHVKDGARILKEANYPRVIVDICEQHLGTTLIQYFFSKAKEGCEEAGLPAPEETDFRYPGPKPQTREAALVFLADSAEAAAKSIPDPTPAKLKGMVNKIIDMKFLDGQFDECDLTLKDLHEIAAAFTRALTGLYHHRPQYPHQKQAEKPKASGKGADGARREKGKESHASAPANGKGNKRGGGGDRSEDDPEKGPKAPGGRRAT